MQATTSMAVVACIPLFALRTVLRAPKCAPLITLQALQVRSVDYLASPPVLPTRAKFGAAPPPTTLIRPPPTKACGGERYRLRPMIFFIRARAIHRL